MTAVHAPEIKNVKKNYPIGILITGIILVVISVIGALIITLLVPASNLNMLGGVMQGFEANIWWRNNNYNYCTNDYLRSNW